MNKLMKMASVSALALLVATPLVAQTAITGVEGLNEETCRGVAPNSSLAVSRT